MATYEKVKLSGDSTGVGIWLGDSASAITVHTTGTSSTVLDELWLYVSNISFGNTRLVSIDFGLTGSGQYQVPPNSGMLLTVPGFILSGNGSSGTSIKATDDSGSGDCFVFGYVNRITP
jgi:hypothetical protein